MLRVLAVDWSGSMHGSQRRTWLAEACVPGRLVRLEGGWSRAALATEFTRVDQRSVIGLDFAFAFPAWFMRQLGCDTAHQLWQCAAERGEEWLARCESPFWGRPGRPRPVHEQAAFRQTELAVPRIAGIAPKSAFQVGGSGSVGTGSIRGMPLLLALHQAGASIWPFDPPHWPIVLEIYPRLLTGPVNKSSASARRTLLAARFPRLAPEHVERASASEDAFDAAVAALVMIEHAADLSSLPAASDPLTRPPPVPLP